MDEILFKPFSLKALMEVFHTLGLRVTIEPRMHQGIKSLAISNGMHVIHYDLDKQVIYFISSEAWKKMLLEFKGRCKYL